MKTIELLAFEKEENICKIFDVSNQIRGFMKPHNDITKEKFSTLFSNIQAVLSYWTGNTYIGSPKDEKLQKAFNHFFNDLLSLLLYIRDSERFPNEIRIEISKTLYQGVLYRYLGRSSDEYHFSNDKTKPVEPVYNDIYVSWSKNESNSYIEGKLYGPMTRLKCVVDDKNYGIDLTPFGVSKSDEEEVVFPTIESTIIKIDYLRTEEYEQSE